MAGPWLVDKSRFASKIKSASGTSDPGNVNWRSNPSRACPNCQYIIDNDDSLQSPKDVVVAYERRSGFKARTA